MANYIKRTDVMKICEGYSEHCFNSNDSRGQDIADRILDDVVEIPSADVVSMEAYKQVRWERDLAVEQLQSYGVGFAEDKELAEVKHGEWVDLYKNRYNNHLYVCSQCGGKALYEFYKEDLEQWRSRQVLSLGCPHCLAKMDGGNVE